MISRSFIFVLSLLPYQQLSNNPNNLCHQIFVYMYDWKINLFIDFQCNVRLNLTLYKFNSFLLANCLCKVVILNFALFFGKMGNLDRGNLVSTLKSEYYYWTSNDWLCDKTKVTIEGGNNEIIRPLIITGLNNSELSWESPDSESKHQKGSFSGVDGVDGRWGAQY